jgi:integrase
MARQATEAGHMGLTVKRVDKLLRAGEPGRHLDGGGIETVRGLYLVINSKTSARWELRYQLNERPHWMGLGSARDFALGEARQRAKAARQQLADGVDPLVAKRASRAQAAATQAKAMTFRDCAERYIADNRASWRSVKHSKQWSSSLATYAYPLIGAMPVGEIDQSMIFKILEQPTRAGKLWAARTETANRVRARIESILDWAKARGLRQGDNPAAWDLIGKVLPTRAKAQKVKHLASLPYDEIAGFMQALRKREGIPARALEFAILTSARSGEVFGATWSEIDLDKAIWVIPGERMKAGQQHVVPLSDRTLEILKALPRERDNSHVFIGLKHGGKLHSSAMLGMLKRMDRNVTAHGFRATFRTWCAERTSYEHIVAELALGHTQSDALLRAYQRGDLFEKRRKLVKAWSEFCAEVAPLAGEVVPIRAASHG